MDINLPLTEILLLFAQAVARGILEATPLGGSKGSQVRTSTDPSSFSVARG
jgi:hypothetical protein